MHSNRFSFNYNICAITIIEPLIEGFSRRSQRSGTILYVEHIANSASPRALREISSN